MKNSYYSEELVKNKIIIPFNRLISTLDPANHKNLELKDFIPLQNKFIPNIFNDAYDQKLFLKSMIFSIFFTTLISYIYYYMVSINIFNLHIRILQLMAIIPLIRTDFFSYIAILIPVTLSFNYYLLKKHVRFGYILFSIPLMFIIMPGILDNFYIFIFNIEVQNRMEIQFVFLDDLSIWQYQFLSSAYSLLGLLSLKHLKKYWHFFAILCFAILIYSSLVIQLGIQTFAYNISNLYYFPMWLGVDIVDVSFMNNIPIYLGINFSIIGVIIFLAFYLKDTKDNWWNLRL
ncbi:MAG: hypothetical protein ACFFDN_13850 [Candidatus Hodarchaeota archaeon]